jgi:HK97 gp10 family phage protein
VSVKLTWYGDKIKKRIEEAQRLGIDETTLACQDPAMSRVRVRTGNLRRSIPRGHQAARREGGRWVGRWGSADVSYALWQEIGTARMSAQPYLRPAAQIQYPRLAGRIRAFFARGA